MLMTNHYKPQPPLRMQIRRRFKSDSPDEK